MLQGKDLLIFDAGTGIRSLGALLKENTPKELHIILSHFHFDHLSGFPFFAPIYNPACTIHIWAPIGYEKSAREIFAEMLNYDLFPVRLEDIKAKVVFREIQEGVPFRIGDIVINSHYAYHPGSTLCFRVSCKDIDFGYVTDNEFLLGFHGNPIRLNKKHQLLTPYLSLLSFFKGCSMMIHEAQYTPTEYQHKVGWGHSSVANAAYFMKLIGARNWVITHHDPKHTDTDLFKKIQLHYDILHDLDVECTARLAFDSLLLPF
jgi:phosphoribosyl 1,2-cyclic phosphodiesterase